jgi:nucleoside phosphorylase
MGSAHNLQSHRVDRKNIILALAANTEFKAAENIFPLKSCNIKNINAYTAGILNNYNIILVRSEIGALGPWSSTLALYDAIDKFSPEFVIMAGVAFGLKNDRQSIGDILISTEIVDYETGKLSMGNFEQRGATYIAARELIAKAQKVKAKSHSGQIISGSKIVDCADFRKNLICRYPHAIGGEMEGRGLAASCIRHNISWILIKAVSDWGIYKSDGAQYGAALNSIQFCKELIKLL